MIGRTITTRTRRITITPTIAQAKSGILDREGFRGGERISGGRSSGARENRDFFGGFSCAGSKWGSSSGTAGSGMTAFFCRGESCRKGTGGMGVSPGGIVPCFGMTGAGLGVSAGEGIFVDRRSATEGAGGCEPMRSEYRDVGDFITGRSGTEGTGGCVPIFSETVGAGGTGAFVPTCSIARDAGNIVLVCRGAAGGMMIFRRSPDISNGTPQFSQNFASASTGAPHLRQIGRDSIFVPQFSQNLLSGWRGLSQFGQRGCAALFGGCSFTLKPPGRMNWDICTNTGNHHISQ